MPKTIVAIGMDVADESVDALDFTSSSSLLDWDIVLFCPHIPGDSVRLQSSWEGGYFEGKPCLDDYSSFAVRERLSHWSREISSAVEAGKTVIVFLPELQEYFAATGNKEYSGTGRNQKTTRIVGAINNYQSIPLQLSPVSASGKRMKLIKENAGVLEPYWAEFGGSSEYKTQINPKSLTAAITTKAGDKAVGAVGSAKASTGSLVLLPYLDLDRDDFYDEDDENGWSEEAKRFGKRLTKAIRALDKAIRGAGVASPPPEWSYGSLYEFDRERDLRTALLDAERKFEEAGKERDAIRQQVSAAGEDRRLLYEQGVPLENAVIRGLIALGFRTERYKDNQSEFDVVFTCDEGRLLGEAEGKDNKAINVEKLRQLSMNIMEDVQREEVTSPAKPVLFGNGYRLTEPDKRPPQFTDKCISAASVNSTVLVPTSELFAVVRYLANNPSSDFGRRCREAILTGVGMVKFPEVPPPETMPEEESAVLPDAP